jgi:hypothetical protein
MIEKNGVVIHVNKGKMMMVGPVEVRARVNKHLIQVELRNCRMPEPVENRVLVQSVKDRRNAFCVEAAPSEFKIGGVVIGVSIRSGDKGQIIRYYVRGAGTHDVRVVDDPEYVPPSPNQSGTRVKSSAEMHAGGPS